MQMAVDEALLQNQKVAALRFYRWRAPAVSFGYFGRFEDVANYAVHREIVRRWTGGGIVLHGEDLTYSFIVPAADPSFGRSSREIYSMLHKAIQNALQLAGINATLADGSASKVSEACFANPVRADVLVQDVKVAGAAQRRTHAGLLHQGSIQVPFLGEDFTVTLAATLCPRFETKSLTPRIESAASLLAETKYQTTEWLTRR